MKNNLRTFILSLLIVLILSGLAYAKEWSFVVFSDNHGYYDKYKLTLNFVKSLYEKGNPEVDFMLAAGDTSPVEENWEIYNDIFPDKLPTYFPAAGNHELDCIRYRIFISQDILGSLDNIITRHDEKDLNYYFDWDNVRIIMLDQYSDFGIGNDHGWVTKEGAIWLQETIEAAPEEIEHIFIVMHEPPFGRFRHTRTRLSDDEANCWNMLVEHKRVKAVFCGHVHNYYKMQVKDPQKAINPASGYPHEKGGLLMINDGSAGTNWESDKKLTVVQVIINDAEVNFKTYQSPYLLSDFKVTESWALEER
jgi:hypothetical protein